MKFYFATHTDAWEFAKAIVLKGRKIVDYGIAADRMVDIYYIEVE